jgi:hypothetical protein
MSEEQHVHADHYGHEREDVKDGRCFRSHQPNVLKRSIPLVTVITNRDAVEANVILSEWTSE